MKCPSWAYNLTMRLTSDIGPKHDDLCPCCTTTWISDIGKFIWYKITRQK